MLDAVEALKPIAPMRKMPIATDNALDNLFAIERIANCVPSVRRPVFHS